MKTRIALTLVALMVGGAAFAQTQGGTSGGATTGSNATNTGTAARGDVTRGNPDRISRNRTKAPQNRDKAPEERGVGADPRDNTTATGTGTNNGNTAARDADRSSTSGGSEMRGSSGTTGTVGTNSNGTNSTNEPARNGDLPAPRTGGMNSSGALGDKATVPPVK